MHEQHFNRESASLKTVEVLKSQTKFLLKCQKVIANMIKMSHTKKKQLLMHTFVLIACVFLQNIM